MWNLYEANDEDYGQYFWATRGMWGPPNVCLAEQVTDIQAIQFLMERLLERHTVDLGVFDEQLRDWCEEQNIISTQISGMKSVSGLHDKFLYRYTQSLPCYCVDCYDERAMTIDPINGHGLCVACYERRRHIRAALALFSHEEKTDSIGAVERYIVRAVRHGF